jgi:hypothetical protein
MYAALILRSLPRTLLRLNLPENADIGPYPWLLSVCSDAPVAESQSQTVLSQDADATSLPSGENTTALTALEWPLSVCSNAPQLSRTARGVLIHCGTESQNRFLIWLVCGLKIRAELYTCRGVASINGPCLKMNFVASITSANSSTILGLSTIDWC